MLLASAIATVPPVTARAVTSVSLPADPAAEIAHALTPRENLRAMILMTLDRGGAQAPLAARVGEPRADALLSDAAENSAYAHADQWERELAAAYREALTPAELAGALTAVRAQRMEALAALGPKVGPAFFRRAAPLLNAATAEAQRAAAARVE
ncbi:hypothetical protein PQ455_02970 [Sphingomonas naphthae]|uniref:DUF2059 domain-containing protein n=1 Tax=Sphingomonas naphthae TaxID=1813468 RepID=A0ABY7TLU6_9SPHN|nr:hypothetical protein [Sphingomonas naphthae]WCT74208.1 hypothetical protein PQ455_02970 [Sphingomonas naphthae]